MPETENKHTQTEIQIRPFTQSRLLYKRYLTRKPTTKINTAKSLITTKKTILTSSIWLDFQLKPLLNIDYNSFKSNTKPIETSQKSVRNRV